MFKINNVSIFKTSLKFEKKLNIALHVPAGYIFDILCFVNKIRVFYFVDVYCTEMFLASVDLSTTRYLAKEMFYYYSILFVNISMNQALCT